MGAIAYAIDGLRKRRKFLVLVYVFKSLLRLRIISNVLADNTSSLLMSFMCSFRIEFIQMTFIITFISRKKTVS